MKNPILITLKDGTHVEIGDPYILRFNGKYYLYPSTCDEVEGIRCFFSTDLINYEDMGLVAESPILRHAYAPEVIYHNGKFIMATSPRGNGHYFLESDSPLGPFKFVTDNMANMIDGSFVIDKMNKLHFLRADHNGIAYLDFENNQLTNRKDILPQIGNAWTEGPSITYFKDYYYATYCGNDVLSSSYRIMIASSKYLDKDYQVQSLPLLLSTKNGYSGLGHNSVVLGPSLDEYFVAYHKLDWIEKNRTTRYLCLDRLYFNKRNCACNYSDFEILSPRRPDFECDVAIDNKLLLENDKLLTPMMTEKKFTAEFNFKGPTQLIVEFVDEKNYIAFIFDKMFTVMRISDGKRIVCDMRDLNFDINHFHAVRIISDKKCEILIDNVPFCKTIRLEPGRIGYVKHDNLYYTAFTNSTYTKSMKEIPFVVPGKIEASYTRGKYLLRENSDDVYSVKVEKGHKIKFLLTTHENKYDLFMRMKNQPATLLIKTKNHSKAIDIRTVDSEYEFNYYHVSDFNLTNEDYLEIEVLEGAIEYQYLAFEEVVCSENVIKENECNFVGEHYEFTDYHEMQSLTFTVDEMNEDTLFGFIVNAKNYSDWRSNKRMRYMGYFVGFDNNLLVVDYCQYNRVRIYDKPYHLENGKTYEMKVVCIDNVLKVYINQELVIKTTLKYDHGRGLVGLYKNKYANVSFKKYLKGECK